jgi:hypothetical protein
VLRNDVVGRIMMKCLLSDMPELRLGLNEKIEDITFHQVNRHTRSWAWAVLTWQTQLLVHQHFEQSAGCYVSAGSWCHTQLIDGH